MGFYDRKYYGQGGGPPTLGGTLFQTPGWQSFTTRLILLNVAVLFLDAILGRMQVGSGGYQGGWLMEWGSFSYEKGVAGGQVWRFVSYQFLHGGLGHLFFNMLALFFFAPWIERYLGSWRFLGFYLLCGIGGAVMYLLLFAAGFLVDARFVPFLLVANPDTALIGASGCVLGVLVAAWRVAPDATVRLFFVIPIPIKVLIAVVIMLDIWVMITGTTNAGGSAAHLGGALVGYLLISHPSWLNFIDRIDIEGMRQAREQRRRARERQRVADHEAEVDRILAKVKEHGLQSLTEREKRTLAQETDRKRDAG